MAKIKIYSWDYCPYCVRAKRLLEELDIAYEEINLDGKDEELQALQAKTKYRTVPQIFIGEEFIGGFQELSALNANGELQKKLNTL